MQAYNNQTATANFTAYITWTGGWGALYVGGSLGGGTVTLNANDGGGSARSTYVALGTGTTLSAAGWGGFWAPAGASIQIVLSGSTSPTASVTVFTQN